MSKILDDVLKANEQYSQGFGERGKIGRVRNNRLGAFAHEAQQPLRVAANDAHLLSSR